MSDFIIKEEFFEAEADTSDRFRSCPKPAPCPVLTGPDLSGGAGPVVLPTAAPSINFSGAVTAFCSGRSGGHLFTDSTVNSDDDLIIEGDSPSVGRTLRQTLSGHSLKKPPDLRVDEELVLPNSEL